MKLNGDLRIMSPWANLSFSIKNCTGGKEQIFIERKFGNAKKAGNIIFKRTTTGSSVDDYGEKFELRFNLHTFGCSLILRSEIKVYLILSVVFMPMSAQENAA